MQKLNIPLSSHRKTTRRSRRVVWLLVGLIVASVLLLWRASTVWFTNPTIFHAAPDGTVAAVQLLLNERSAQKQLALLKHVPLISNRSITLADLLPFTQGELAWFIDAENRKTVAIRSKEPLPEELLQSLSISSQRVDSQFYLLSERLEAVSSGIEGKRPPIIVNPFKAVLGQFVLKTDEHPVHGFIKETSTGIDFITDLEIQKGSLTKLSNPSFYLSTPVWSNKNVQVLQLLAGFFSQTQAELMQGTLSNTKTLFISEHNGSETHFLLETTNSEDPETLLKTTAAYNKPRLVKNSFEDGSAYQELRIDPDLVTVSQSSIQGNNVLSTSTTPGSQLLSTQSEDGLILTSSEELLIEWLKNETQNSYMCPATNLFAKTSSLLEAGESTQRSYLLGSLSALLHHFPIFSLESKNGSSVFHLCSS